MSQTSPPAGGANIVQASWSQAAAARALLARTAELPGSKHELLAVLSEYRAALFAFAVENDKPCWGRRIRPEQLTRTTGLTAASTDAASARLPMLPGRVDVLRGRPAIICELDRGSAGGAAQ
jgi:hypothetical protein